MIADAAEAPLDPGPWRETIAIAVSCHAKADSGLAPIMDCNPSRPPARNGGAPFASGRPGPRPR
jgi:hypothetical protein